MPSTQESLLPTLTPALAALLDHYRATLPTESFESFVRHLARLRDGYRAELSGVSAGAERARALHRLLTREIAASDHLARSCTRGCASCCHLEVEITRDEGEALALALLDGHPADRKRLAAQAARPRKDAAWEKGVVPENRCVFLGTDNDCTVYEIRPAVCRKALVTSPASFCADRTQMTAPLLIPLAELIVSVALSFDDNPFASVSRSVSDSLARFEELRIRSRAASAAEETPLPEAGAPRPAFAAPAPNFDQEPTNNGS